MLKRYLNLLWALLLLSLMMAFWFPRLLPALWMLLISRLLWPLWGLSSRYIGRAYHWSRQRGNGELRAALLELLTWLTDENVN